tara:strand:+ start:315 stop:509 length:195 start_codon:yes stop_codon:yes gene_type:complete
MRRTRSTSSILESLTKNGINMSKSNVTPLGLFTVKPQQSRKKLVVIDPDTNEVKDIPQDKSKEE